jgi:hypothetical protein
MNCGGRGANFHIYVFNTSYGEEVSDMFSVKFAENLLFKALYRPVRKFIRGISNTLILVIDVYVTGNTRNPSKLVCPM